MVNTLPRVRSKSMTRKKGAAEINYRNCEAVSVLSPSHSTRGGIFHETRDKSKLQCHHSTTLITLNYLFFKILSYCGLGVDHCGSVEHHQSKLVRIVLMMWLGHPIAGKDPVNPTNELAPFLSGPKTQTCMNRMRADLI